MFSYYLITEVMNYEKSGLYTISSFIRGRADRYHAFKKVGQAIY